MHSDKQNLMNGYIKKRLGKILTTMNITRKLTNTKLQRKRTHNLRTNTQRQSGQPISHGYSDFADQKSLMFIDKIMDRMDTSHHWQQTFAKYEDTTKTKYMTGLMDTAIAKVNQNEID